MNEPASLRPAEQDARAPAAAPRRPYGTPRLTVYGAIRDLTQAVTDKGMADGGGGMMDSSAV